jgi:hypothetical protein
LDELTKVVVQKTGLPPDVAAKAVRAILDYLKENLPEPLAGQLEGLISGSKGKGKGPADIIGGLGGLLGR